VNPWHDGYVPDKPTSEQIRREVEKLRDTAIELIEHAKTLIEKSVETGKAKFPTGIVTAPNGARNRDLRKGQTRPRSFTHVTLEG
jgi:hypothetical protein